MRKFYFLLMAAITLSMSAFENASVSKVAEIANLASMPKVIRSVAQNKLAPVATATDYKSETWVSLGAGKFVASAVAECYGSSTNPVDVEIFEAQGKTGLYKVVGVWADLLKSTDGTLYVDATDPEFVVIEDQFTGIVDKVDGNTHIASLSAALLEKGYTKAQILALDGFEELNITLSDKVITIPEGSLALRWPEAPADSQNKTNPEKWYSYGKNDGAVVLPGGEYVDPWSEAVDATMVETILGPAFGKTNTTPYTIQIQKNSKTGVYRLISPWRQLYTDLGYGSTAPNLDIDIQYLKKKIDAGAEYIVTQMFFDNEKYFAFVDACRRAGITVPIIPGLKPIVSPSQMTVLPKTFHVDLPSDLVSELMKCNDSASTRQVGVEWCAMQARDLLSRGVESIHFYSLNAVDSVKEVAKIVY